MIDFPQRSASITLHFAIYGRKGDLSMVDLVNHRLLTTMGRIVDGSPPRPGESMVRRHSGGAFGPGRSPTPPRPASIPAWSRALGYPKSGTAPAARGALHPPQRHHPGMLRRRRDHLAHRARQYRPDRPCAPEPAPLARV